MGSQRVGRNWATFTFTQKIKISCYLKVVIGHSESLHPTLNDTHTGNSRHSGMTMAASHGDIAMCTKRTGPIFDLLWTLRIAPLIQSFHFQMRECSIPQILTINGIWDLVYGLILILGKFCTYYWTKRDPVVLTLILVMKVKVAQLCPALCNPMDYTVHGILQNTGVGSLLQGIFPTQGSNPGLPHCRWILCKLSHKGSPRILEWVACPFSSRSSQPRNWTRVSCIAGGFLTNWATR